MGARRVEASIVDAFATEPLAGTPAGVVTAGDLTDAQCRAVAGELGAPETAFAAEGTVRVFDAAGERAVPGHATVAALARRHESGALSAGEHDVGERRATVEDDGTAWASLDVPTVGGADVSRERVAGALGVDAGHLVGELPLAVADAGEAYLLVPVDYLNALRRADGGVGALLEDVDAAGLYAFTFDTLDAAPAAHGRVFGPGGERLPSGRGCAAAAGYLRWADAYDDPPETYGFEMGRSLGRAATVRVRLDGAARVGGRATTALTGDLRVPDPGDDDIVVA